MRKLHEANKLLGEGQDLAEVLKSLDVPPFTFHRWRHHFGGVEV